MGWINRWSNKDFQRLKDFEKERQNGFQECLNS